MILSTKRFQFTLYTFVIRYKPYCKNNSPRKCHENFISWIFSALVTEKIEIFTSSRSKSWKFSIFVSQRQNNWIWKLLIENHLYFLDGNLKEIGESFNEILRENLKIIWWVDLHDDFYETSSNYCLRIFFIQF